MFLVCFITVAMGLNGTYEDVSRSLGIDPITLLPLHDYVDVLGLHPSHVGNFTNETFFYHPMDGGVDLRVTKALGSKGYNKVRVSVITQTSWRPVPSFGNWDISHQFIYKWTANYIHSKLLTVNPGQPMRFNIGSQPIEIKIPEQGKSTKGIFWADVCFYGSQWCIGPGRGWDPLNSVTGLINAASTDPTLDYWMILGDNFYDPSDRASKSFFGKLTLEAKQKVIGTVLGNHDFWIMGNSGNKRSSDNFGIGMMQWWAYDSIASRNAASSERIFDYSINPNTDMWKYPVPSKVENFFWYNIMGNVGFIAWSGAHSWGETKDYLKEACSYMGNEKPDWLIFLSHWDENNEGCQSKMYSRGVFNIINSNDFPGCNTYKAAGKLKYMEGHNHCNRKVGGDDGYMIGGAGMSGCTQFGFMYMKTEGDSLQIYYFDMARMRTQITMCLNSLKSIDNCLQYAKTWLNTSGNPPGPNPPQPGNWISRSLVADEGNAVGSCRKGWSADAKNACDANPNCHSVSYSHNWQTYCMKSKCVTANEPGKNNGDYVTWYKSC